LPWNTVDDADAPGCAALGAPASATMSFQRMSFCEAAAVAAVDARARGDGAGRGHRVEHLVGAEVEEAFELVLGHETGLSEKKDAGRVDHPAGA
jgi:hypothetical protein